MSTRTKKSCAAARVENPAQVVDARRAIDREAQLRQLERDVAADARGDNPIDHREVRARRGIRFRHRGDALAEQSSVCIMPAASIVARGGDRFVDGLAGDEPPREAASGCACRNATRVVSESRLPASVWKKAFETMPIISAFAGPASSPRAGAARVRA